MSKTKASAAWNDLSAEQRETLEKWLFEENLSYPQAHERARKELGFAGSVSSVVRFYRRTAHERLMAELAEARERAAEITGTAAGTEGLRASAMQVIGQLLLRQVTQNQGTVRDWSPLARLLLQSEHNDLQREWLAARQKSMEVQAMRGAVDTLLKAGGSQRSMSMEQFAALMQRVKEEIMKPAVKD